MNELPDLRLHWVDGTIIVAYLLMLVAVGIYHSRRPGNLRDFFLAGGNIKWLAVGLSLMAALNSGMDYLMQPSAIIRFGLFAAIGSLSWLVLYPYVFHIVLPLYRRLRAVTVYEYLEQRFDLRVRLLAAGIFLLWRLGWMATALYVPSLAISVATGGRISVEALIMVIGCVVTLYTMLGGIRAVIWNDVIQFCLMAVGLIATIAICLANVEGGVAGVFAQLSAVGADAPTSAPAGASGILSFFVIPMTFAGMLISVIVARLGQYTSDQVMVQRMQTARSIHDARRAFLINAVSDTIWMLALCFVGLALYSFFQSHFGQLPVWAMDKPDQIFPYFMSLVFPVGLVGLVLAAILAASISSIDSALNSLTSVVMVDFVQRLFWKQDPARENDPDDQKKRVLASRIVNVAVGAVGIAISLNVSALGSLLEIANKIINSFAGPILGIYLLGMFSRRAHSVGVLVGGVMGTCVTLYVAFQGQIHGMLNRTFGLGWTESLLISFLWTSTFGLVATLLIGIVVSVFLRRPTEDPADKWIWASVVKRELKE